MYDEYVVKLRCIRCQIIILAWDQASRGWVMIVGCHLHSWTWPTTVSLYKSTISEPTWLGTRGKGLPPYTHSNSSQYYSMRRPWWWLWCHTQCWVSSLGMVNNNGISPNYYRPQIGWLSPLSLVHKPPDIRRCGSSQCRFSDKSVRAGSKVVTRPPSNRSSSSSCGQNWRWSYR